MAPPPPPPGGRNKTRLIIGAAVGAAVLIGGAIAAGVLLTSENDTGPKGNAKAFIAAYNAASAKASRNHPPVDKNGHDLSLAAGATVCKAYSTDFSVNVGSLYTIEYHPQLTLVSVTQHGSTATVTVIVTINGGVSAESGGIPWRSATEQLHLNSDRRDGSWKLCDTSFNGEGPGNNPAPWPSLVPPDGN